MRSQGVIAKESIENRADASVNYRQNEQLLREGNAIVVYYINELRICAYHLYRQA